MRPPGNEETARRVHGALEGLDGPSFRRAMERLAPAIPGWVEAHLAMEHTFPSPSGILRCRLQQWYEARGAEPDQDIPVGWKLRRMMGILSEPLWLAVLDMAGFEVGLPGERLPCGPHMAAHLDGTLNGAFPVELKHPGGVGFKRLINSGGVTYEEPGHYAQLQLYMHAMKADAGLYLASPPDPGLLQSEMRARKRYGPAYELDPVYVEWVAYDANTVESLLRRAETLHADAQSDKPPMREYDGIPEHPRTGRRKMPCGYCPHLEKCNLAFDYGEGELVGGVQWD